MPDEETGEVQEFFVDLLFYNYILRRFVVIDLKIEDFKPEFAGKMNFYLNVVDELQRQPADEPSIGLILCPGRNKGRVHGEDGRFSPVLWGVSDSAGRRITLTRAALRHARGEDEQGREVRAYLTDTVIKLAVARGGRYADAMPRRERLVAGGVGPSAYLVVVVEIPTDAGTVVTAHAMRRMPDAWRQL